VPGVPGPSLLQRAAQQPAFQSGLRGTGAAGGGVGSGGGSKRSNESRSMGGAGGKGDFVTAKKKKKLADKILPQKVRDLVPESQAYMDLLTFERKLDATIMRKRLDIQEALKRPMKQKRKRPSPCRSPCSSWSAPPGVEALFPEPSDWPPTNSHPFLGSFSG